MQRLVDKAERLRARRPTPHQKSPPRPKKKRSPVNFRVYYHMYKRSPGRLIAVWLFIVMAGYIAGSIFERLWIGHLVAATFAARYVLFWLGYAVGLGRFYRFPGKISFTVDGWETLLSTVQTEYQWRDKCVVTVCCHPDADTELIGAAGDLFVNTANKWIGRPSNHSFFGTSKDPREKWQRIGLSHRGSGNAQVIGDIYRFVHRLDRINRRVGGIQGVVLEGRGHTWTFEPTIDLDP